MTTRSALVGLLRAAGVDFIEARCRVLVDISKVEIESLEKFNDFCLVFLAFKFSNPRTDDHFRPAEAHEAILHFPIVGRVNGVFSHLKTFNRLDIILSIRVNNN